MNDIPRFFSIVTSSFVLAALVLLLRSSSGEFTDARRSAIDWNQLSTTVRSSGSFVRSFVQGESLLPFRVAVLPIFNSMLIRQRRSDGSLVRILSAQTTLRYRLIAKDDYQVLLVSSLLFDGNRWLDFCRSSKGNIFVLDERIVFNRSSRRN